jgi:hypothetical protein
MSQSEASFPDADSQASNASFGIRPPLNSGIWRRRSSIFAAGILQAGRWDNGVVFDCASPDAPQRSAAATETECASPDR